MLFIAIGKEFSGCTTENSFVSCVFSAANVRPALNATKVNDVTWVHVFITFYPTSIVEMLMFLTMWQIENLSVETVDERV